jgi:hypothetical protein
MAATTKNTVAGKRRSVELEKKAIRMKRVIHDFAIAAIPLMTRNKIN